MVIFNNAVLDNSLELESIMNTIYIQRSLVDWRLDRLIYTSAIMK